MLYYFKYFIGDQNVVFFGKVSQTVLASVFMSTWLGSNIIGVLLAKPVSSKYGKKNTFMASGIISVILSVIFFFLPPSQISLIFLLNALIGIAAGIVLPLIWSMYADIADYSEWKTGRRATGLIFSSSSMSQKFGWTLGGAISGWILAVFGFEANVAQSAQSLLGIRLMISIFAGFGALLSVGFMYFYPLNEKYMHQIENELEIKRNNLSTP
jgi:GPH family glycoside/pentoside/hexuronide:cation symporter